MTTLHQPSLLAIGNNCCDIYVRTGMMYPGGECANTAVYARRCGLKAGFLGMFGEGELAEFMKATLAEEQVDLSHCRTYEGENGYTLVKVENGERFFIGRNYGGVMRYHGFDFTQDDLDYIRSFDLVYAGLHAHANGELPLLKEIGIPIAYDFSFEHSVEYFEKIAPYVTIGLISCADLSKEERENLMRKAAELGVKIVVGTVGVQGSYVLYEGEMIHAPSVKAEEAVDSIGAGDSYFAAFLSGLLKNDATRAVIQGEGDGRREDYDREKSVQEDNHVQREHSKELPLQDSLKVIENAMKEGAAYAAAICAMEGPYGKGTLVSEETLKQIQEGEGKKDEH